METSWNSVLVCFEGITRCSRNRNYGKKKGVNLGTGPAFELLKRVPVLLGEHPLHHLEESCRTRNLLFVEALVYLGKCLHLHFGHLRFERGDAGSELLDFVCFGSGHCVSQSQPGLGELIAQWSGFFL